MAAIEKRSRLGEVAVHLRDLAAAVEGLDFCEHLDLGGRSSPLGAYKVEIKVSCRECGKAWTPVVGMVAGAPAPEARPDLPEGWTLVGRNSLHGPRGLVVTRYANRQDVHVYRAVGVNGEILGGQDDLFIPIEAMRAFLRHLADQDAKDRRRGRRKPWRRAGRHRDPNKEEVT